MNDFKEWLSDYLRYFLLLLAAVLTLALVVIGVRVYQGMTRQVSDDNIEILTDAQMDTEEESMEEVERLQETEDIQESETASAGKAGISEESVTEAEPVTEAMSETKVSSETEVSAATETEPVTETLAVAETEPVTEVSTAAEPEPVTEVHTETEYVPVYKTLKGSCYIRSGPSMEAEIIGEYMYGTTVEFLEDVGGWYKVQIDGMTGYMGARFF